MKITEVKPLCLRYTYETPVMDGCNTCGKREAFLVLVETDVGITGIGESATFGIPLTAYKAVLEDQIAPLLIGEDPLMIEYLWEKLLWNGYAGGRRGIVRGVASAIDIALWDIMGKVCGQPLYRLFGANSNRVNAYASAGFYAEDKNLDGLKQEMDRLAAQGYKAFKMKVGRATENSHRILRYMTSQKNVMSLEEDFERIRTVRKAIGDDSCLMLDMNGAWGIDTIFQAADFLEEMKIYSIEEPICSDDAPGYRRSADILKTVMISGGENEQGLERYRQLIAGGSLDIVQANLGWSGGFTEVKNIIALCRANHKLFSPHSFFSAVLIAANLHISASQPNVPFIESEENPNPLRTDILKTPFTRDEDMAFRLPDAPGLGIDLNMDIIEQYHI